MVGGNFPVGSNSPPQRNVISGNARDGIQIGGGANTNKILGNLIGLNADGTAALGNGRHGVSIFDGSRNQIGGERAGETTCTPPCNLISGNNLHGVLVKRTTTSADANRIQGNFIGIAVDPGVEVGNFGSGVLIDGGTNTLVGGNTRSKVM